MHHHILGTTGQWLESDQLPIQPKFFSGVYGYSARSLVQNYFKTFNYVFFDECHKKFGGFILALLSYLKKFQSLIIPIRSPITLNDRISTPHQLRERESKSIFLSISASVRAVILSHSS